MTFPTPQLLPSLLVPPLSSSFLRVVSSCNIGSAKSFLYATDALLSRSVARHMSHQGLLASTTPPPIWMKNETCQNLHFGTQVVQSEIYTIPTNSALSLPLSRTRLRQKLLYTHPIARMHLQQKVYQAVRTLPCCQTQLGHNAVHQVSHPRCLAPASLSQRPVQLHSHVNVKIATILGCNNQVMARAKAF